MGPRRQQKASIRKSSGRALCKDKGVNKSERLHHKQRNYIRAGLKSGGLTTSAGNQISSSEEDKSKPQLKGSKQQTEMGSSGQDRTNKDIQPASGSWNYGRDIIVNDAKSK